MRLLRSTSGRTRVALGLIVVAAVVGVVVAGNGGRTSTRPAVRLVRAERGAVAVTVGGLGHVATLSGAAHAAAPATSGAAGARSAGAAGPAGGSPPDAVFPAVSGHITRLLVRVGQRVAAGQPIATLSDDGTTATAVLQARSDLATARLELLQKRVHDPALGLPATMAERSAARQAIITARAKLARIRAPALPADVAAARLDVTRAVAELRVARAGRSSAMNAAELSVLAARQRLALLTTNPSPAVVAAAQLELAKATVEQETLLRPSTAPSATAIRAADLAIAAAQQRLTDALAAGAPADIALARADVARAQTERELLGQTQLAPTDAARGAAQLTVDVARRRLDEVLHPPPSVISAANEDVSRARADLAALRVTRGAPGAATARGALSAASARLRQLRGPAQNDVVASARLDVRKAQADLAVLRQHGAPASAVDLALARLKVDVGAARLSLANQLTGRLAVRASGSGTVTSVLTAVGAAVDPATPVARIADLDHLVVTLDLSEFDVGRTRVGAPVLVSVDALPGHRFGGRVIDVGRTGTDNGGVVNFPVVIALRSQRLLRPGMTAAARIVVARRLRVVRIPVAAVVDAGGRARVTVRGPAGATTSRAVKLGLSGAQVVEVRSGLRVGEQVVTPARGG